MGAAEKMVLWDSWLRGGVAESDWASVWQAVIGIYCQLAPRCCVDRLRPPSNSGHSHHRWMSRAKTPTADSVRHARGTRSAGAPETIRTPDLCTASFHA